MTPLSGLKVIELARILAGPWAGQILADLGAEVVKVEAPQGDDTRRWGPPFVTRTAPDGSTEQSAAYFHSTNRGKKSVIADFRTPEGRQKVLDLIADADILIENFKAGGLAKYGLDYDSLRKVNPRLVYCSVTGFGQTGPYAHRAGYDYIIQGMCGLMSVTGEADAQPQKVGVAVTDLFTGIYGAVGILAALRQRDVTGEGQHVDMSLLDVGTAVMANQSLNYLATGDAPRRMGNAHPNLVPYAVFDCADGWAIIAVGNDEQFQRLCAVLGLKELEGNPDYATNAARIAQREALTSILNAATAKWTRHDLLTALEGAGIPAGPINDMDDVFADPQIIARGLRIDPEGVPGVRLPITFSKGKLATDKASPFLGQDD